MANDASRVITARTQRCYRTAGMFVFRLAGSKHTVATGDGPRALGTIRLRGLVPDARMPQLASVAGPATPTRTVLRGSR
jgi:hypothetical protein